MFYNVCGYKIEAESEVKPYRVIPRNATGSKVK